MLIHSGEPSPFWLPKDKYNERWLELKQEPDRYRPASRFPPFETIIAEQHHLFRKHPKTRFIDAHLGWLGNDLLRLGKLLDELPNVYTELGAVLAELGRQPRFDREWMIRYQDRVLFGKETYKQDEYHTYFRVLETAEEYFDYYRKRHAHWKIYGLELPDAVLRKVYYRNALTLFPSSDRSLFPAEQRLAAESEVGEKLHPLIGRTAERHRELGSKQRRGDRGICDSHAGAVGKVGVVQV